MDCLHTYPILSKDPVAHLHVAEDAPPYRLQSPASDHHDGKALRLAMSLVVGAREAARDREAARTRLRRFCARAVGRDVARDATVCTDDALGQRLMALERDGNRQLCTRLQLLVRFADAELYRQDGCRSMIQWMDQWLNLGRITASERLRVGRALQSLPMCESLFALGKLSYSKARIITRYATAATDEAYADATLELSTLETEAWCEQYRHEQDAEALAAAEDRDAAAELLAFDRRALRTRDLDAHRTRITLDLPKDLAAEFLCSLEHCEDEVRDSQRADTPHTPSDEMPTDEPTAVQRRADAAVMMSRRSLAHAGEAVSTAERYRVHVTVDAHSLAAVNPDMDTCFANMQPPFRRALINGRTPISTAMARRLATQAGFTSLAVDDLGTPVGTQLTAVPFSRRQLKALRARDGCCQMPGCGADRHLDGHHVVPRSEGGCSTLDNAVLLCSGCHRLLHEGGFRLERDDHVDGPDLVRRYRLFDAGGRELGSRGAALQRATLNATVW